MTLPSDDDQRNILELLSRIRDNAYSTPPEIGAAEEQARAASSGDEAALQRLQRLRQDVEGRASGQGFRPSSGGGSPVVLWDSILGEIGRAESKWERLASIQFWIGTATPPILIVAALTVALVRVDANDAPTVGIIVGVVVVGFFHSFFVLRIHQQARQAAERMTEKRVGLSFLRLAVEGDVSERIAQDLLNAGTNMFLGHQASSTIPLSPDDLKGVRLPGI